MLVPLPAQEFTQVIFTDVFFRYIRRRLYGLIGGSLLSLTVLPGLERIAALFFSAVCTFCVRRECLHILFRVVEFLCDLFCIKPLFPQILNGSTRCTAPKPFRDQHSAYLDYARSQFFGSLFDGAVFLVRGNNPVV